MTKQRGAVLFDLDGTLVDSAPDISDAVDQAHRECGLTPPGEGAVRGFIGNCAVFLIHRAISRNMPGQENDGSPADSS